MNQRGRQSARRPRCGAIALGLVAALGLTIIVSCGSPTNSARHESSSRDIGAVYADPCTTLLDEATWEELGYDPHSGGPNGPLTGGQKTCQREATDSGNIVIGVDIASDPLKYAETAARWHPSLVIQHFVVDGLPAHSEYDPAERSTCQAQVRTGQGQGLRLVDTSKEHPDPAETCERLLPVLEEIVTRLPAKFPGGS